MGFRNRDGYIVPDVSIPDLGERKKDFIKKIRKVEGNMSYPLCLTHSRVREVRKFLETRLSGIVKPDKIQSATVLAMTPFAEDRTIPFTLNAASGPSSGPELERLIPVNRVCEVYGMGFGFAKVPIVGGSPNYVSTQFSSNPYTDIFSAVEQKVLLGFFNGKLDFKTDQAVRFDSLKMDRFMIETYTGVEHSIKPTQLDASFTMVGGEENTLSVKMPSLGSISGIQGPAEYKLYAVALLNVFDIIGDKARISAALRGM